MKKGILILVSFLCIAGIKSQTVIKLWDGEPPTSNGASSSDEKTAKFAYEPEMTVYLPDASTNTGLAVIICPGGGYSHVAIDHEGHQLAEWLKSEGIAGIVLKYRLPNKVKTVPLEDVHQAFRIVRSKSKEWNIDKIGIAGSSAGGHLASTASTRFKDNDTRPDFSILFYPVITMDMIYTHNGTRSNLLGDKPTKTDLYSYSNENQVNSQTPPAILLLSDDDKAVVPENSIRYYEALKNNGIPAAMYIFPSGGHGWGMKDTFKYKEEMLQLLKMWLETFK